MIGVGEMYEKLKNKKSIVFSIIILFLIVLIIVILILNSTDLDKNDKDNNNSQKTKNDIEKTEKEEISIDATKEYYCPSGFTLNGTNCEYTITTTAVKTYDCEQGIPIVTTGECSFYGKEYAKPIWYCITTDPLWPESTIAKQCSEKGYARNLLGCPSGYYPDENNTCSKVVEKRTPAKVNYLCPEDYKVVGNQCKKTTYSAASYKYKCPTGYKLVGKKCIMGKIK